MRRGEEGEEGGGGEETWVRAQGTPPAQPEQLTVTQGSSKDGRGRAAGGLRGRKLGKFLSDGPQFLPNTRKRMIGLLYPFLSWDTEAGKEFEEYRTRCERKRRARFCGNRRPPPSLHPGRRLVPLCPGRPQSHSRGVFWAAPAAGDGCPESSWPCPWRRWPRSGCRQQAEVLWVTLGCVEQACAAGRGSRWLLTFLLSGSAPAFPSASCSASLSHGSPATGQLRAHSDPLIFDSTRQDLFPE